MAMMAKVIVIRSVVTTLKRYSVTTAAVFEHQPW
jgi:hypothetical protein